MIAGLGTPEIIIIGLVIILLFGVGRIGKIAGELGGGIRSFKKGLKGDEETPEKRKLPKSRSRYQNRKIGTSCIKSTLISIHNGSKDK